MKRFGTIFPFVESDDTSLKLGRHVANYDFFIALLTHSNFDEFHIFCMSAGHFTMTQNRLQRENIPTTQKQKVRLFLYKHLREQISSNQYHVFHLGGWGYFFPGLVYLRNQYAKNKFPITGLIHSLNGMETNYHALKILVAPLASYDTIICSSKAGKKVVENVFDELAITMGKDTNSLNYKGSYSIIPLGINENFLEKLDTSISRKQLSISQDSLVFLSLGRISPQTKYDPYPMLQTFKRLCLQFPKQNLELIIAGGASDTQISITKQMIKELELNNSVRIITNFDSDIKQALYSASDIYLALSDNLQETFGISVIEAMGAGLPVVVSDINGYKELIDQGEQGYKISTMWTDQFDMAIYADFMNFETMQLMLAQCMVIDTEEVFTKCSKLITDIVLRNTMGNKGVEKVKSNYLWSVIIPQYEKLWDQLFDKAQNDSSIVEHRDNPFVNKYLSLFNHYPSTIISDTCSVVVTEFGQTCLKQTNIPAQYNDISTLIDTAKIISMLETLTQKTLTVGEMIKLNETLSIGIVKYSLLWMAKYGLITIRPSHLSCINPQEKNDKHNSMFKAF